MVKDNLNLVSKLSSEEEAELRFALECISPDDAKYRKATKPIRKAIGPRAEWEGCFNLQYLLLETRAKFGKADRKHVKEVRLILDRVDSLNASLLEEEVTRHDQQAVLAEIGRFVTIATRALLHPGVTSYDILDTVRSSLFKKAWFDVMRPKIGEVAEQFCDFAEDTIDVIQVGRTHIQDTSPVPFGVTMAGYARRISERAEYLDRAFDDLRGKVRGMVGTGASIEMIVGKGRASDFEKAVLGKLGLKPDLTATQVTQKERLVDVGHGLVTLASVLGDFAGDVRLLYSSAIRELVSSDSSKILGGSSADAAKDNPINYENMEGKVPVIESGMRVLYSMISTDLQRDLRSSVQGRYQPQQMMAQVYEMFVRMNKAMKTLCVNKDKMSNNLISVREFPSEAMVAILRGEGWMHPDYGDGHDFVKNISQKAKANRQKLLGVALTDERFKSLYETLPQEKQRILQGEMELYVGDSPERARDNITYARKVFE
ncbi:MAG: hypothetical protein IIA87_00975 [Nanoarchaeota archaeon]|nr:hypothetical protein [Nanoarchaeota archaeon]